MIIFYYSIQDLKRMLSLNFDIKVYLTLASNLKKVSKTKEKGMILTLPVIINQNKWSSFHD